MTTAASLCAIVSMRLTSLSMPGEWPTIWSRLDAGCASSLADRRDVPVERAELGEPLQLDAELFQVDRLRQVVEGAFFQDGDGVGDRGVPGHHDRVRRRASFLQPAEQRQAVELRKPHVGHHDVEHRRGGGRHRVGAVLRAGDLVAFLGQCVGNQRAEVRLIFNDQDLHHVGAKPRACAE